MKTVFKTNDDGSVTVEYDTAGIYVDVERITRTFWTGGRYVREGHKQVCAKLSFTGPTLMASDDSLAYVIRREYRAMRRAERKQQ